ncbi:MAG: sigma 54-interacting transcriptional regulator [Deltaproteobacteria bacterium]|nr:sigma 54-interacting transcriptional regulator [Deltaproteobacteria bacterium]
MSTLLTFCEQEPVVGYELAEKNIFGRELDVNIQVMDKLVSRRHAQILRDEVGYILSDLGSRNGTFLNGVQVKEPIRLNPNDEIKLGDRIYIFDSGVESLPDPGSGASVILLPGSEPGPSDPFRTVDLAADAEFEPEEINLLYRVARLGVEILDTDALLPQVADQITSFFSGNRLVILGLTPHRQRLIALATKTRRRKLPLLKSIVTEIMTGGKGLIGQRVIRDVSFESKSWKPDFHPGHFLAVPLTSGEKKMGLIYLDRGGTKEFTIQDLNTLAAVGSTLGTTIDNATRYRTLYIENFFFKETPSIKSEFIAREDISQSLLAEANKAAAEGKNVLIMGPAGSGKKLLGRRIHGVSPNSKGPFIAVNCGSGGDAFLERELFGYEKGAFEGASAAKRGKIELAQNGTIFLDKIDQLGSACQIGLARVMQAGVIYRVGGGQAVPVDVRVIAASGQELISHITQGNFKQDLADWIGQVKIHIPPLRQRPKDLRAILEFLIKRYNRLYGKRIIRITQDALKVLEEHPWPGNVKELENMIERIMYVGTGTEITAAELPFDLEYQELKVKHLGKRPYLSSLVTRIERDYILETMKIAQGNARMAVKMLGISDDTFEKKCVQYGISLQNVGS